MVRGPIQLILLIKIVDLIDESFPADQIADFGLSNVFDDKHRLDTFCGSPLYASPEIVKGIPYTGPEVRPTGSWLLL